MLFPRSPLKFVRLCYAHSASQTSGLCNACTSVPFGILHACVLCFACLTSQTPGLCSACASVPFGILHACVFMFCVQRFSLGPFWVCTLVFVTFCYAYFASQTSGLCSAFLSVSLSKSLYAYLSRVLLLCVFSLTNIGFVQCLSLGPPVKFVRLSLSCYAMRISPHQHQFRAVLFSRLPFKFPRLYWSCFVKTVKFVSAFVKHFETL